MPLLLDDPVAHRIVVGAAVVVLAGEVVPTLIGQARGGMRRGYAPSQDRGTKWFVFLGIYLGIAAALAISRVPALRAYANNWWTLGLGIAVVLAGVALRSWAIVTLGPYFRRVVTIEAGQRIVRQGPYRVLRHPSYAGLVLIFAGFGLAFGSWLSSFVALVIVFAGMLPRIRVEERALAQAFGAEYTDYAKSTARVIPYVW